MVKKQDIVKNFFENSKELPMKFKEKIKTTNGMRWEITQKIKDVESFVQKQVLSTMYGRELYRTDVIAETGRGWHNEGKREVYTLNHQGLGTIFEWINSEDKSIRYHGVARSEPIRNVFQELVKENMMENVESYFIKHKSKKIGTWQDLMKLRPRMKILQQKWNEHLEPVRYTATTKFLHPVIVQQEYGEMEEYALREVTAHQFVINEDGCMAIITNGNFVDKELSTNTYRASQEEKNSKILVYPTRAEDFAIFMQLEDEMDVAIEEMQKKLSTDLKMVDQLIEEIKNGLAVYTVIAQLKEGGN